MYFIIVPIVLGLLSINRVNSEQDLWKLVTKELQVNRVIGAPNDFSLTSADFYVDNLKFKTNFKLLSSSRKTIQADGNFITGNGIVFNPSKKPILLDVILPLNKSNVCGLVVGSAINGKEFIKKVRILWRSSSTRPWNSLAVPTTGDLDFNLDFQTNTENRVIMIDQVPAEEIRLIIHSDKEKSSSIRLSVIHECQYSSNIQIDDCSEAFENNEDFQNIKSDGPISISCPTTCNSSSVCIGFKVYSTSSSTCWAAHQMFGNCGDGNYFLYRIPRVHYFKSELNPALNNGIYCRSSNKASPGITFNRVYYDYSNKESEKNP